MKFKLPESFRWIFYSSVILFFFLFAATLRWSLTPTFIDIYYHLSVMLGFGEAGGFTANTFWEYAPIGRAHLYPPFFHFLMLLFYKCGVSVLSVGRFFEFIIFPLLLLTLWKVVSSLFSGRLAFFCLLITASVYSFYLSTINFIPASIALLFGLLAYFFIEKRKILSSSIFLCLAIYTHFGIASFFVMSLVLYAFLNKERLKNTLLTIIFALTLALPILLYTYNFRQYVLWNNVYENFLIEINLWVFIAAIAGVFIVLRRKKRYFFFLSLLVVEMFMLLFKYKYRYLCGHGILGPIFLSALTLDIIYDKASLYFSKKKNREKYLVVFFVSILFFFLIFSPTVQLQDKGLKLSLINSTYVNFLQDQYKVNSRGNDFSIYFPKFWQEVVDIVKENSQEDDIIFSNLYYVNGLISIFSKRATSTAMLREVKSFKDFDPIEVSKLIIWIKNPEGVFDKDLSGLVNKYNLEKIAETETAYIYRNPYARGKKRKAVSVVPIWLVYSILSILAGLVVWENASAKKTKIAKSRS